MIIFCLSARDKVLAPCQNAEDDTVDATST